MPRRPILSALIASALFVGTGASADVPPPVGETPAPGETPGTGGLPPIPRPPSDPPSTPPATPPGSENLPDIPAPGNRPSNPQHPDTNVGNQPPPGWYNDMYEQIYYTSSYFSRVETWAYNEYRRTGHGEVYAVYTYASYMRYSMTSYFWTYFEYGASQHVQPRYFPAWGGYATRGDFNYNYSWYIRPVYREFLRYAGEYYQHHSHDRGYNRDHGYGRYSDHSYRAASQYHSFTKCNFGKNGLDPLAKDDTEVLGDELAAGISGQ